MEGWGLWQEGFKEKVLLAGESKSKMEENVFVCFVQFVLLWAVFVAGTGPVLHTGPVLMPVAQCLDVAGQLGRK